MHWILFPFRLISRVGRRILEERLILAASALSFDTMLALVPMIAVSLSLPERFESANNVVSVFEKFLVANLLPKSSGSVVANYLGQFAHQAENIPLIGGIALFVVALVQTLTIEYAFNAIWKVNQARPLYKRVLIHLLVLILGPLIIGGTLAVITLIASVSFGLIDKNTWVTASFFSALPILFMSALFSILYWAVPHCRISRWHALFGGTLTALGFVTMQRLFSFYVANFSLYAVLYGAFSVIPIFLIWLFLSWGIILVGALIVAELPGALSV